MADPKDKKPAERTAGGIVLPEPGKGDAETADNRRQADRQPPTTADKADAPKSGLVTTSTAKGEPAKSDAPKKADKPEKFRRGPGPDDPSVPYDGGFDRDDDDK